MGSASPDDALEPTVFSLLFFVGLVAIGAHWHFSQNDPNHQVFVKLDPPLTQLYTKVGQINVPWIQQSPRRFCAVVLALLLVISVSSDDTSECIEIGMAGNTPGSRHYEEDKRFIEKECNSSSSCASAIVRYATSGSCKKLGKGNAFTCATVAASQGGYCD